MRSRASPWLALSLCTLAIALLWCVFLPWLSARPRVQQRLEFLAQRGIDPSAMFYTELDLMDTILDRIEGQPNDSSAFRPVAAP